MRVTRSSPRMAWRRPPMSVPSGRMVRNFVTTITDRPAPKRGWRKNTGPGESSRTARTIIAISGATATRRTNAPSRSITDFSFQDQARDPAPPGSVAGVNPWLGAPA